MVNQQVVHSLLRSSEYTMQAGTGCVWVQFKSYSVSPRWLSMAERP